MKRTRLPDTRNGVTRKFTVGEATLYITVNHGPDGNPIECFGKADEGHGGELDGLCILASLALQHGCPGETISRHLRHRRYAPEGTAGQPCSISDALGRAIEGADGKAERQ